MITKRDAINEISRQADTTTSSKLTEEDVVRDLRRWMEQIHLAVRDGRTEKVSDYIGRAIVDALTVGNRMGVDVGDAVMAELEQRESLKRRGLNG